jgi:hypothetical protein
MQGPPGTELGTLTTKNESQSKSFSVATGTTFPLLITNAVIAPCGIRRVGALARLPLTLWQPVPKRHHR